MALAATSLQHVDLVVLNFTPTTLMAAINLHSGSQLRFGFFKACSARAFTLGAFPLSKASLISE